MTEQKHKSAGYFDSVRNCPVYEGDVYYDATLIDPFFRVVYSDEKGFMVHHVGSTETFKLCDEGALLIQRQYIGNEFDNPNVIAEFTNASKEEPKEETVETENEETSETTPEAIEEQIATVDNEELKENITTMFETPENKESKNEPICSTDTDVTTTENAENTDKLQDNGTGTDTETVERTETTDKPTKNVIVEVAKEAVPEIIANTKDEKNAVLRKKFISNLIAKNREKIAELEVKVAYHTELAQTLDYKPFVKLKDLVQEALHTNVDDENLKGIKERTKDYESILNIQGLLKQHQQKAKDADFEITDLEDEISKFEDELAELNAKIDTFARQNKLPLDM